MYTEHAATRCQQRGIAPEVVEILLAYGTSKHRHGADIYFMDHRSRRRATKELGRERFAKFADRLNAYVVLADDGTIITAAPRCHRMKF